MLQCLGLVSLRLHTSTWSMHSSTWSIHSSTWSHKSLPWLHHEIIVLHHTWSYRFRHLCCEELGSYQVEKVLVMCWQDQTKHKSPSRVCSHCIVVPQNTCKKWQKWSRVGKDHVWRDHVWSPTPVTVWRASGLPLVIFLFEFIWVWSLRNRRNGWCAIRHIIKLL